MSEQERPTDGSDERPRRPSPRPRPTPGARPAVARPSPRPRVAGTRRDREDEVPTEVEQPAPEEAPARDSRRSRAAAPAEPSLAPPGPGATSRRGTARAAATELPAVRRRRGGRLTALVLAVLCVLGVAGGGWLLWERLHPAYVDPSLFSAARSGVEALYAYDYQDSEGSVQRKLDVLTGDLQDQYRQDLSTGGIIDTYQQVSATTSYDVAEVGLQQVNQAQDQATVVVFGQYVVKSVNSGTQQAPSGSECTVTAEGAQACTQTVQVTLTQVGGDWKISGLTLLTTS